VKRIRSELPAVAGPSKVVGLPLLDDEKIPDRLEGLVSSPIEIQGVCNSSGAEPLFRAGDAIPPSTGFSPLWLAIHQPEEQRARSFHSGIKTCATS
jgi:hypothetical protein